MAKDNIEFKSLISQGLNFESPINNSIDCKSRISNDLNFDSPIGIEDEIISNWVLLTGFWNDSGVWEDDAIWID